MRWRAPPVRSLLFAVLVVGGPPGCGESGDPVGGDGLEATLEIVGESEPVGVVEGEADLSVRVRSPGGTPIEGAQVFWTVEEGEAQLAGNPTLSGPDGVARQTVSLGEIPGIVVIRATLNPSAGDPGVVFRVQVSGR